jgi:opacity protein-like surface antigen
MPQVRLHVWVFTALVAGTASSAAAQTPAAATTATPANGAFGVHAALGTDVALGVGFGAGATYVLPGAGPKRYEIGVQLFMAHSEYTDDEGLHSYTETTDMRVLAIRANILWNYTPHMPGMYFVAGTGAAGVYVEWEERSPTDTSLGTPLSNGGSKQSDDGAAGALVANAGLGYTFGGGFDVRIELPILIFSNGVGEAATFAPTVVASAGYRF